jgi:hypothetical protein
LIDLKFGYVVINNKGHVKLEFWVLKRFATKKNSSKFIIILMHESECYFFLHLLHQNSCLVFVKKNIALFHQQRQRFIESQDIPETENTFGLDGREAKFYMYIQSTTMERPDLERTMEQVLTIRKAASALHWNICIMFELHGKLQKLEK